MAMTQKCFIEVFKNTLKSNETRFKLVWRVAKPNGALWRVTWENREYVCRYEDNLTTDPETGNQVGIFSQNGEESVLVYRIPQKDKDYYAPEKIAQRAREADEALASFDKSQLDKEAGKTLVENCVEGDVVTFVDTRLNIDTLRLDELGTRQGVYQRHCDFNLGVEVLLETGSIKVVHFEHIVEVASSPSFPQPFQVDDIVEPVNKTDWQYGQVTACYELDGFPGEWCVDIHKLYETAPGILARCSETCLNSVRRLLAAHTVQLHVETPEETKNLEKAGRDMVEKAETGDVVTFVEYGQECQGTYQGLDRGNMGIRVMYKNNLLGIFFEDIRAISHQTPDQTVTPACYDRHGHQVDQTITPDPETTQEQADALVDSLDMTSFVEGYELNELGHVYTLVDGSAIVVTSPSVYRWEV